MVFLYTFIFCMLINNTKYIFNQISPRRHEQLRPESHHESYNRRDTYTPERRDITSPSKRPQNPREDHARGGNAGYETPNKHQVS